jgi:hypothetical protein
MKSWKTLGLIAAMAATAALAAEVAIDYKSGTDFSKYKTFAWQTGAPAVGESMNRLILSKIEAALTAAGFKRVDTPDSADLHVIYSVVLKRGSETKEIQKTSPLTGLPKWDYSSLAQHGSMVDHTKFVEGSLAVDIEEAKTSTLLWSGVASGVLLSDNPEDNEKKAAEALRLLLKDFPPKATKPASK